MMIAVVTYGWLVTAMPLKNAHMDYPSNKAFSSAPSEGGGSKRVPTVETLLPVGMPAIEAIGKLTGDDFAARVGFEKRSAEGVTQMSANNLWEVAMTFDAVDGLLTRSPTRSFTSL